MARDNASLSPRPEHDARPWPRWLRLLVVLIIAAALSAPLVILRAPIARAFTERDHLVAEIRGAGPWGPLVLIGLSVVQTIVAPIPGQAINFVGGYLFGLGPGLLYSWAGLVLGSTLAMVLARYAGRPLAERIVGRTRLAKVDALARGRGLRFFFLFFLIPGLPDDVLCFVAGFTPLPLRVLVLLSATARLPGLLGAVWLGAYAEQMPWPLWLVLGGSSAMALWAIWRYGDRIQDALLKLAGRRSS